MGAGKGKTKRRLAASGSMTIERDNFVHMSLDNWDAMVAEQKAEKIPWLEYHDMNSHVNISPSFEVKTHLFRETLADALACEAIILPKNIGLENIEVSVDKILIGSNNSVLKITCSGPPQFSKTEALDYDQEWFGPETCMEDVRTLVSDIAFTLARTFPGCAGVSWNSQGEQYKATH